MSIGQLKILQEVIALSIFVPFSYLCLKEKLSLDYPVGWAPYPSSRLFHLSSTLEQLADAGKMRSSVTTKHPLALFLSIIEIGWPE